MTRAFLPNADVKTELIAFDGLSGSIQGIVFHPPPSNEKVEVAIIFVHGVEHFWFLGPTMFLAPALAAAGYTTMGYNGTHSGLTFRHSRFEDAVTEINYAVAFMKSRGFHRIILVGHSLGTPIIERYAGSNPDETLEAIILLGPHDNLPEVTRSSLLGPELYEDFRAKCKSLVADGCGDELSILPYRPPAVIITSAKTFLSYRDIETSLADVRDCLGNISVPMLIMFDPMDNIHGLGKTTLRQDIAISIQQKVSKARVTIKTVPSIAGVTPVQAHSFLGNELRVIENCRDWLNDVC